LGGFKVYVLSFIDCATWSDIPMIIGHIEELSSLKMSIELLSISVVEYVEAYLENSKIIPS
jgi:hypothetical protein